jgi:hypothetical protein
MPSRFTSMKRNAPTDFEESERPVKMLRRDLTPNSAREFATITPTPTTALSPIEGALKRKREALNASEDLTASKRVRLGASFGVSGTTTTLPTGCRGGKRRRNGAKKGAKKGAKRATVAENDEVTAGDTSPPLAVEDTAEVSASTEEEAAVTASEDAAKAEGDSGEDSNEAATGSISTPSTGEDTAEVSKAEEEDAVSTAIECVEDYLNACVSEDTAEVPTATECVIKAEDNTDAPVDQDTAEVSTFTEGDAAATTSESAVKAENDSDNSSEPVSSSRKSVSGSIESSDSSSSSEPASSSQKSSNGSSETLETILSASESEEAPKKTSKMAVKKERYITGLINNGNQCFANATLQFFDAAMDGHDLDLLLDNDVSIHPFSIPALTSDDQEFDINAPRRGKKPLRRISKIKASIRYGIKKFRSLGSFKAISQKKHLRALLSHMRGSKGTPQPSPLSPMVFQQVLAFGGADESVLFNHLDGTTQEDCFEYFSALMAGATSDAALEDGTESATALESLFEIKSEITKMCNNPACDYKGTAQADTATAISTFVWEPKKKAKKILELTDMLDVSSTSTVEDFKCPECGEEKIANLTELKETSDNLVVHINRVDPSGSGKKFQTQVELPLDPVEFCGKRYILNAVVRHKGLTVHGGHYTIVRRRSSEWMTDEKSLWYLINDDEIEGIKTSDVRDGTIYGHSAMLLFKAL